MQVRVEGPGAQLRRRLRIRHQPHDAVGRAECGFEVEQHLDCFGAGAGHPARRRALRRNMKLFWLCACQRLLQHCRNSLPAGHGLDRPGEGQHVAPETVRQEKVRGRFGVFRLQCRAKLSSQRCASAGAVACFLSAMFIMSRVRDRSQLLVIARLVPANAGHPRLPIDSTKDVDAGIKPGHDARKKAGITARP